MTVRGLLIAVALLAAAPVCAPSSARAACRLHAIWHYPWPQRCGVGYAARRSFRQEERDLSEPKDWYVEIVLTPQALDEISHGLGIDKIKQLQAQKDGADGH
jgi:hypothetical protein